MLYFICTDEVEIQDGLEIEPPAAEEEEDPVPDLDEASNEAEKEQSAAVVGKDQLGQHKFFMELIQLLLSYLFLSKLFNRKFAAEPDEPEDKEDPVPEIPAMEVKEDTAIEAK